MGRSPDGVGNASHFRQNITASQREKRDSKGEKMTLFPRVYNFDWKEFTRCARWTWDNMQLWHKRFATYAVMIRIMDPCAGFWYRNSWNLNSNNHSDSNVTAHLDYQAMRLLKSLTFRLNWNFPLFPFRIRPLVEWLCQIRPRCFIYQVMQLLVRVSKTEKPKAEGSSTHWKTTTGSVHYYWTGQFYYKLQWIPRLQSSPRKETPDSPQQFGSVLVRRIDRWLGEGRISIKMPRTDKLPSEEKDGLKVLEEILISFYGQMCIQVLPCRVIKGLIDDSFDTASWARKLNWKISTVITKSSWNGTVHSHRKAF